jgi:hypothetical protein
VLTALLLQFLVVVHGTEQMFDVVHEEFTVGETAQQQWLAAMGTFQFTLLY